MLKSEQLEPIKTREDFLLFMTALSKDLAAAPATWTNNNLPSFLEAMAAWTADMDGYYKNRGETPPEQPSWKMFADMMMAAAMYE